MKSFIKNMLLKKIINRCPKNLQNLKIKGLAINSKNIRKNFIFFAIKGNRHNGEYYINHAIRKGANVIVCSNNCNFTSKKIYVIKTSNVRDYLSKTCSKFYRLKPKNIFAVTGTNGKTSVADFFYQILSTNNIPVASIGTLGIKIKDKFLKTSLTTPDIITLHKSLEKIKKKNINNVIIEASSHGLEQGRLNDLNLKAAVFTNLSQDHLDYHKNMKNYLNSKLILFKKILPKKKHIITDSKIREFHYLKKIIKKRGLKLLDINKKELKTENLPKFLFGAFQLKNLHMAILLAKLCKLDNIKIYQSLKRIKKINGRLELIKIFPNNVKVFVDYAHTPDALKQVLKSIGEESNNSISIVFGCGGDRDHKKRPLMAKISKDFCKKIYVTDDNPRSEDPKKIRKLIVSYLKNCEFYNIGNRSKAIKSAILNAEPNEIILVAGKGHENYQDYGSRIIFISDKDIIKKIKIRNPYFDYKNKKYLFNTKIMNEVLKDKKFYKINGLAIDSRYLKENNLFIAIKGKKKDGNNFIDKAIKKGANHIISTKRNSKYQKKVTKVTSPINFLNSFAKTKRKYCKAKILAITGSVGKTSLKNMLQNLLQNYGKTFSSPLSYNNHFGVPVSLSNLSFEDKFGIFEAGMSKPGEINQLSKMIKPNLAIITNIAEAHIENFKNIKGIAKAKSEIINNIQINGTVILNRDDKFFSFISNKAKSKKIKIVSFGNSTKSDIRLIRLVRSNKEKKILVRIKNENFSIKIKDANIYNVLASLAVLQELKLDIKKTLNIFKNSHLAVGRGKIFNVKRYRKFFKLIDESYNANPLSVKNAIKNFSQIKKRNFKKYLLLGDMLELGNKSNDYHSKLSKLINNSDIDKVFVKGEKTLFTYKNLKKRKRGNIIQCNQDVDLILRNIIENKDYLMIKGSNATGLQDITKSMIRGF